MQAPCIRHDVVCYLEDSRELFRSYIPPSCNDFRQKADKGVFVQNRNVLHYKRAAGVITVIGHLNPVTALGTDNIHFHSKPQLIKFLESLFLNFRPLHDAVVHADIHPFLQCHAFTSRFRSRKTRPEPVSSSSLSSGSEEGRASGGAVAGPLVSPLARRPCPAVCPGESKWLYES